MHQPTFEAIEKIRGLIEFVDNGPEAPMKEFIVIMLIKEMIDDGRICEKHAHELVSHAVKLNERPHLRLLPPPTA